MDNFDLRKYLAENKLNEELDLSNSAVDYFLYALGLTLDSRMQLSDGRIVNVSDIYNTAKKMEEKQRSN